MSDEDDFTAEFSSLPVKKVSRAYAKKQSKPMIEPSLDTFSSPLHNVVAFIDAFSSDGDINMSETLASSLRDLGARVCTRGVMFLMST